MSIQPLPEVEVTALGLTAATATVWRLAGQLHVTVIIKGTFTLTPNGAMMPAPPEEIVRAEVHHNKNPMRSVRLSTDLAPYLPRADVLLTGHAWAEGGRPVPSLSTRLVVFRDTALIDKTVHLHGDVKGQESIPFDRMPLLYERAYGGVGNDDNPLGVGFGASSGGKLPNLSDPTDATRVACFGPIPRGFPVRKRLLGATDRKQLDKPVAELPADFDWSYFQAAPLDQRIDFLRGDEWIILDGFHPEHTHLQSHLPGIRGFAQVHGLGDPEGQVLALAGDTLRIDTDQLSCSVVFRASFPVDDEALVGALQIAAGIEIAGQPLVWPEPKKAVAPVTVPVPAQPAGSPFPEPVFPAVPLLPAESAPAPAQPDPEEDAEPLDEAELVVQSLAPPPITVAPPELVPPLAPVVAAPEPAPPPPLDELEEVDVDSVRTATLLLAQHVSRSVRPPPAAPFQSAPPPPMPRPISDVAPAPPPIPAPPPAVSPEVAGVTIALAAPLPVDLAASPLPPAPAPAEGQAVVERVIEAATRVTIRCGAATVTLEADGRVTLEGTSFELHARGPVKVSGESVAVISSGELKVDATGKVEIQSSGPMQIDASGPVRLKGSNVGIN